MSTNITGNIKDLSGGAVTSNTYLRFILRGLNGNIPRVNGTALVAQNPGFGLSGYWFDLVPNASGQISGTLYSTRDAAGTGNGEIEAGGSLTAVWYGMVLFTGGNPSAEIPVHAKNGVTLDISNVTPITSTPVSTAPTGDSTYARLDGGNQPFIGPLTVPGLNKRLFIDGVKYPATAAGINQAITDAQANGCREIWLPAGTTPVNATINIIHGGFRFIGCGGGLTDAGSTPATMLQWTGAAGTDMISILGGASARIDPVVFQNMILDGNGTARYVMRSEKVDDAILDNVRLRNGATACFYAVDATGWKFRNVQFSQLPAYGCIFDWGTGGFDWTGGNIDVLLASTQPAIFLQGAINSWHMRGVEMDASQTGAFVGYLQINGFDANSAFASAPTGGAGAPQSVGITDCSVFQHATANAPSQGADFLITGTAGNHAQKVVIERVQFNGLSISAAAVKVDNADNCILVNCQSSGHTASTLIHTGNGSFQAMWMVLSTDAARVTGAGAGLQMDLTQGPAGQLASIGSISANAFVFSGASSGGANTINGVSGWQLEAAGGANVILNSTSTELARNLIFDSGVKITQYNGIATVGTGASIPFAQDDKTGQSASIGAVTLITGTASTGGHYTLHYILACTATDASGATVTLTANWTADGVSRSTTSGSVGVNSTGNNQSIMVPINADNSTNITYSTTVTGVPTTGRYSVHIWLTKE